MQNAGDDFLKKARKACAFTGHRPKKLPWGYNETDVRCVALKTALERQIRSLVQEGVMDFLSGMAEGVDLLAAEIVLYLRSEYPSVKLHCILPYKGQETEWSAASQARYHAILAQADSIIYVSRIFQKIVCWSAITFWPLILMFSWPSITVSIGAAQRRPYATRRNWNTA